VKKRKPANISQADWDAVDSPEWTDEDFARARPARKVLPEIFGKKVAAEMLRPRGRPPLETTKVATSIRLDADVVRAFKVSGKGWQGRINLALKDWLNDHDLRASM
jgi:uncharacterized protein (DUF4415 family)